LDFAYVLGAGVGIVVILGDADRPGQAQQPVTLRPIAVLQGFEVRRAWEGSGDQDAFKPLAPRVRQAGRRGRQEHDGKQHGMFQKRC